MVANRGSSTWKTSEPNENVDIWDGCGQPPYREAIFLKIRIAERRICFGISNNPWIRLFETVDERESTEYKTDYNDDPVQTLVLTSVKKWTHKVT